MANNAVRNRYVQDGAGSVPQPRLLVMLYDKLVLDLEEACVAIRNADWPTANYKLLHAQDIVLELHSALDKDAYEGGHQLSDLYTWFDEQLTLANVRKAEKLITGPLRMIKDLRDTWKAACEQILNEQVAAREAAVATVGAVAPA